MSTPYTRASKFLSFVLRHDPQSIGLSLDREGWAVVDKLLVQANHAGQPLTADLIRQVVETSDKKRFSLSEDGQRIRAVQGHSTEAVAIAYAAIEPPEVLFHGTATRFLDAIREQGLLPQRRQYVHLSADEPTAIAVGQRHGKPVVLRIDAGRLHREGHAFYQAENGVWLTAAVPVSYFH